MRFPHLAQRLFNVPLAIHQRKAEVVMAALADRLGVTRAFRMEGSNVEVTPLVMDDRAFSGPGTSERKGYEVVAGVAVIEISGTLVNKLGTLHPYSGMTGYDGIRQNFLMALADSSVEAIAFDIDSPGGEVSGCFDLVDTIFNARGQKPTWAILTESAYSGAYAIASATDRIVMPRTGGVGSIGVIAMHIDWSQALTNNGIKVTFITYGDRKADGHAEIPLSAEAFECFKADVDAMGELFVQTVARNRNLSADQVRATEAGTFMGKAGVDAGLADEIMSPDAAFNALLQSLG